MIKKVAEFSLKQCKPENNVSIIKLLKPKTVNLEFSTQWNYLLKWNKKNIFQKYNSTFLGVFII